MGIFTITIEAPSRLSKIRCSPLDANIQMWKLPRFEHEWCINFKRYAKFPCFCEVDRWTRGYLVSKWIVTLSVLFSNNKLSTGVCLLFIIFFNTFISLAQYKSICLFSFCIVIDLQDLQQKQILQSILLILIKLTNIAEY